MVSANVLLQVVAILSLGIIATAKSVLTLVPSVSSGITGNVTSPLVSETCPTEESNCFGSSVCAQCIDDLNENHNNAGDDGSDGVEVPCEDVDALVCETYGASADCLANSEYAAYIECAVEVMFEDCSVDELCGRLSAAPPRASSETSESLFGCPEEGDICGEEPECLGCVMTVLFGGDDDETDGSTTDEDSTCDERQDYFCASEIDASCLNNENFISFIECAIEEGTDCKIDATCSGATAFVPARSALLFTTAVAGFLVATSGSRM